MAISRQKEDAGAERVGEERAMKGEKALGELVKQALGEMRDVLEQETGADGAGQWDPDAWEEEVRRFTRQLGQGLLQIWGEVKSEQAKAQAPFAPVAGGRRHLHRWQPLRWLSAFGRIQVQAPYLRCPKDHSSQRPFQELTGLQGRGKSRALQRALSDFGAEKSFEQASRQLKEHYGVELHRSSLREVVQQAERATALVDRESRAAIAGYASQTGFRSGEPWLIVESDGSMVRTGELVPDPAGGVSPVRGGPKRIRRTQWREVRLSVVEAPGRGGRRYAAALGSPQRVGEQMFALALGSGYGDNTWVHGVGDGAPWIAQQVAAVFPRQRYLLDRYHLLEHRHEGASALAESDAESAQSWVREQARRIDAGGVAGVVAECRGQAGTGGEHTLNRLAGYLENRQDQLDYATAQQQGLPIGSGAVEGGHRHVIQARLKLPGAWWKEETVNPLLALRTLRANDHWEAFWN